MSSKNPPQTNPEKARRGSLGSLLRSSRENRNTSLDEAAAATRISVRILTALEGDDFATLPAEVFTRGFIKLYAEYLGLELSEVLKLFTDQENLDPERPADRPYRRDILFGTAMAHPLQLFRGNPRLRIIVVLVAVLLSFYALGAVFKSLQKHPGQDSPENEVAKSLVNGRPPALPGPPGVALAPLDGTATLAGTSATTPQTTTVTGGEATSSQSSPAPARTSAADRANSRALSGESVTPTSPDSNQSGTAAPR